MIHVPTLGLRDARTVVDTILDAAASSPGSAIAVAVVDREGDLLAFVREDGCGYLSRHMARRKAYTSARLGADTSAYGASLASGGIDIAEFGDPQFTRFGGGVCLRHDDAVIGAVGVSGRTAEDDETLARIGAGALGT